MRIWFYRFTAAHFCVTAITGILLYFARWKIGQVGIQRDKRAVGRVAQR